MTGGGEDRGHGFWIEAPGAGVAAQFCGGLAGGPGGPVWPWLEHGLVTVGGCQDAGRRWDGVAGQSGRVAGPVKTLALLAGQGRYWCQRRGLAQHALRELRGEADAFPLGDGERPRLVPDGIRHTQAPNPAVSPAR